MPKISSEEHDKNAGLGRGDFCLLLILTPSQNPLIALCLSDLFLFTHANLTKSNGKNPSHSTGEGGSKELVKPGIWNLEHAVLNWHKTTIHMM